MPEPEIEVEVAYATAQRQVLRSLRVPRGTTAIEAVRRSGVLAEWPSTPDEAAPPLGIFGRPVSAEHPLEDGDRVELYRPLTADPKTARRSRVARSRRRAQSSPNEA